MCWIFEQGKDIIKINSLEDIPTEYKKSIGFIYHIEQKSTGRKYIGRKMFYENKTVQKNKIKKKIKKETNWLNYWSSSQTLINLVEEMGEEDFVRRILVFCSTKSQMIYSEECLLYFCDAMLNPIWVNDNIRSKIYSSWFQNPKKQIDNEQFFNQIKSVKCILNRQ